MTASAGAITCLLLVIVDCAWEYGSKPLLPVEENVYITQMAHRKQIVRCAFSYAVQINSYPKLRGLPESTKPYHYYLNLSFSFLFHFHVPLSVREFEKKRGA